MSKYRFARESWVDDPGSSPVVTIKFPEKDGQISKFSCKELPVLPPLRF